MATHCPLVARRRGDPGIPRFPLAACCSERPLENRLALVEARGGICCCIPCNRAPGGASPIWTWLVDGCEGALPEMLKVVTRRPPPKRLGRPLGQARSGRPFAEASGTRGLRHGRNELQLRGPTADRIWHRPALEALPVAAENRRGAGRPAEDDLAPPRLQASNRAHGPGADPPIPLKEFQERFQRRKNKIAAGQIFWLARRCPARIPMRQAEPGQPQLRFLHAGSVRDDPTAP